ncbi:hypothetical protein GCM10022240_05240 [Microbacterium kribbense]|uniref:Uncharacterized protein n=1 Tax=Microbacterium kribbense TaxID=433645 RepID=A0ABP7G455_9MICO
MTPAVDAQIQRVELVGAAGLTQVRALAVADLDTGAEALGVVALDYLESETTGWGPHPHRAEHALLQAGTPYNVVVLVAAPDGWGSAAGMRITYTVDRQTYQAADTTSYTLAPHC